MSKYLYFTFLIFLLSCQAQYQANTPTVTEVWAQEWGAEGNDIGEGVAIDTDGNIYVTGVTYGKMANNINAGQSDIFLSKFNANGKLLWTQQWGSKERETANSIFISDAGSIYIAGQTKGQLDTDSSFGEYDLFLLKCDTAGNKIWLRQWGTKLNEDAYSLCVDQSENILVAGYSTVQAEDKEKSDLLIMKFDSSGTILWTKIWGSKESEWIKAIAIGKQGDLYITGWTKGGLEASKQHDFDDIFLMKLDSAANLLWVRQWGTDYNDDGNALALDAMDNAYVTGRTGNGLEGNKRIGRHDSFLSKYNSKGEKQWTKQWGSMDDDDGDGLVIDSLGKIYVLGTTSGKIDGNKMNGWCDIYLTKFDSEGQKYWTKQWGTPGFTFGGNIIIDKSQFIYITGDSSYDLQGNNNESNSRNALLLKWHL